MICFLVQSCVVISVTKYLSNPRLDYKIQSIKHFQQNTKITSRHPKAIISLPAKHARNKRHSWTYPIIENFNVFTQSFARQRCLVVLNNHQNINIEPMEPIIIVSSEPIVFSEIANNEFKDKHHEILGPRDFSQPQNWSWGDISQSGTFPCYLSPLLLGWNRKYSINAFCFRLNVPAYTVKSKSWNCQAEFHIFGWNGKFVPKSVWNRARVGLELATFPATVPVLNLFVQGAIPSYQNKKLTSKFISGLISQIEENTVSGESDTTKLRQHFMDIYAIIVLRYKSRTMKLADIVAEVENIQVLRICPTCFVQSGMLNLIGMVPATLPALSNFQHLIKLGFPGVEENLIWDILSGNRVDSNVNILDQVLRIIASCKGKQYTSHDRLLKSNGSVVSKLANAYSLVWIEIMGNYSILDRETGNFCVNGEIEETFGFALRLKRKRAFVIELGKLPYLNNSYHFTHFPQDSLNQLRFVSCGRRGVKSFPFEAFVNIFDEWIWLFIASSSVTCFVVIRCQQSNTNRDNLRLCISPLMALMEQGDAFVRSERNKVVTGLFLAMGILLSNAYKNTNLYNMVTPRKSIPYESFEQLVDDNFTVYTRTTIVDVLPSGFEGGEVASKDVSAEILGSEYTAFLTSEVDSLISDHKRYLTLCHSCPQYDKNGRHVSSNRAILNSSLFSLGIKNYSKLQPNLNAILIPMLKKEVVWWTVVAEKFKRMEAHLLNNLFWKCYKVAILLPEYLCKKYVHESRHRKKLVSIGKEPYSDIDFLFTLEGFVPPRLIKKIKGLSEFGIWSKWEKIYNRGEEEPPVDTVVAASMSGNIIVVFAVIACGHSVATLSLVMEFIWHIFLKFYRRPPD